MDWKTMSDLIQLGLMVLVGVMGWRQQRAGNALAASKSAEGSAVSELNVWKQAAERLSKENRDLIAAKSALEAKTDLNPLIARIAKMEEESRDRFRQALERLEAMHREQTEINKEQTTTMQAMTGALTQLTHQLQGLNPVV